MGVLVLFPIAAALAVARKKRFEDICQSGAEHDK